MHGRLLGHAQVGEGYARPSGRLCAGLGRTARGTATVR
jgi:hypothetical protein